ncbi:MAG: protease pro-enzyme activation domain-containing protein [Terracidiphilus sp.]
MNSLILCHATPLLKKLKPFLMATAILLFTATTGKVTAQESLQTLASSHVAAAVSASRPLSRLNPSTPMQLSIVLPLRNQSGLESLLSRLYDPSNPDFHRFLSVEQFTDQFSPTVEDYQTVIEFARANGFTVTESPANRMVVSIRGSASQVEKAFNVRMNNYQHPTENRAFFSPDRAPSIALNVPIAHITGLNNFSIPRPLVSKPQSAQEHTTPAVVGSGPSGSYLSSDMRAAYYTSTLPAGSKALTGSGQTVGLVQFDGYNISDVVSTFNGTAKASANGSNYVLSYTPSASGTTYSIPINNVLLDGATGAPASGEDAEEVLDIVQAVGMAPGLSQVRVYIGSNDADILNAIATENVAQQVSISWAWGPDDPTTDDVFFQEMAAQGQSVFVASGDYGAYSPYVPYYYPAEDAWVTAVGGTSLTTNGAGGAWSSEVVWSQSGGGVSPDGIAIPGWQAGLANSSNGASTTLRNVPDVAMEADFDNYDCNMGSCQEGWAGTSFAAPRWAGFLALANQQAVSAGDAPFGFLNMLIYPIGESASYGTVFHDITSGSNTYAEGYSFNAVAGYDLVTGWGSPDGLNLINTLAPKGSAGFELSAKPNVVSITPGTTSTVTVKVQDIGSFTGTVNLSISGMPNGVTASFSPTSTKTSSVLTLTANTGILGGSFFPLITGTSGALSSTTNLSLTVNAPLTAITITSPSTPLVPSVAQTFKPGSQITIAGSLVGQYQNLSIQWAEGLNPTSGWSTTGVTLNNSISTPVTKETLATWDTTSITVADYYTLQVSASFSGATSTASTIVYLDPNLFSQDWPKILNDWAWEFTGPVPSLDANGNTHFALATFNYTGSQDPSQMRSVSVDGSSSLSLPFPQDGTFSQPASGSFVPGTGDSIVGTDSESVLIWNPDGSSSIFAPKSSLGYLFFMLRAPILADVDNDSLPEIVAMGTQPNEGGNAGTPAGLAYVFAWRNNGQLLNSNFPFTVADANMTLTEYAVPRVVVGDVNGDGSKEFVVIEGTSSTVITPRLFSASGAKLAWAAPTIGIPCQISLADLDHNGKLETIILTCDGTLHVLQPTGAERAGWPQSVPYAFGTVSVGDLNQDGKEEIVVSSGNIYVFNTNGTTYSAAWPKLGSYSASSEFFYAQGVLADINGDGYPEIVTTLETVETNGPSAMPDYIAAKLVALDRFGNTVSSWNLPGAQGETPGEDIYPSVGDFNHDGLTEIAVLYSLEPSGNAPPETMVSVYNTGAQFNAAANDWPMMYRDSSNSSVLRRVAPSAITIASAENPSYAGQSVPITLTVAASSKSSNTPSGVVNLLDGATNIGSCVLKSGSCTVSPALAAGTHHLIAGYVGDINFGVSYSQALAQSVNPTQLSVTVTPSLSSLTTVQALTVTVGVSGGGSSPTPTGSVTLSSGSYTSAATKLSSGSATISVSAGSLAAGTDTLKASYTPDSASTSIYKSGSGTNTVTVSKITPTVTVTPSASSILTTQVLTVTVGVSGGSGSQTSNGSVILTSGNYTSAAKTLASGSATISIPAGSLTAGTDTLTASYTPNTSSAAIYNGASGTSSVTVALPPSFTLSPASTALSAPIGGSAATSAISVAAANGFTGSVSFTASGLPTGVTASFSPTSSTTSSTVSLTAGATAKPGSYTVKVNGTSGTLTASTSLTVVVPTPSFTLSSSASTLNVVEGSSASATISILNPQNFGAPVTLSTSGLPTGVTASYTPATTNTTSSVSFSASKSATPGTYSVKVSGTVGGVSNSATISLTVPTPTFTLSSASATLSTPIGGSATTSVISVVAANGFTGSVAFTANGLPTGVTASFSPTSSATSSTVSLKAGSTALPGSYSINLKGTSGSLTASTTITVTVPTPSFTLSSSASTLNVVEGSSASASINVLNPQNFGGTVPLSASSLPTGVTAAFTAATASAASTVKFSANSSATPGTYSVNINGTVGGVTNSVSISLIVPTPSFAISSASATLSTPIGGSAAASKISVAATNGFVGSVGFTASGLPTGLTASFSPTSSSTATTVSLKAAATATPGSYTITVTGTSGSLTATTTITVTVPTPSFTLSSSASTLNAAEGGSASATISVLNSQNFNTPVTLAVTGLPTGVTATFSPATTATTSTVKFSTSTSATPGTYSVSISGSVGGVTNSASISLTVPTPSFTLSSASTTLSAQIGGNAAASKISVAPIYGFASSVSFTASGLPTGLTASFSPASSTTSSIVSLTAGSTTTPGSYQVTITGTSGTLTATKTITVNVPTPNTKLSSSTSQSGISTRTTAANRQTTNN